MKVINVSSGTDGGRFHHENAMSTVFIFLLGALGGSSKADGAVSSGKKSYQLHLYFFDAMGELGGSQGQSRGI